MTQLTEKNAKLSGLNNIHAYQGSFEELPIDDESINIVISNGAINLAQSKEKVFKEIYRVLSNGGALYFADMIRDETHTEPSTCSCESWADCVSGTLPAKQLIQLMSDAGFSNIEQVALTHYKTSDSTIGSTFRAYKLAH